MHIIIPMSGLGQRFIDAGYKTPKPLIKVDGIPIIEHVVSLFPGENKFSFICNSTHLEKTNMRSVLERIAPEGNIYEIPNHKLGPVYAVSQIFEHINDDEEVIVNYCDFGTYWDYNKFLNHTRLRKADGAIPAYKGFHPHMLGSTNYAFMREENQWMKEIKEKEPFTENRNQEYASNGTYYFRKGSFVKKYFKKLIYQNIDLKGEYYVSLIYNLLIQDELSVSIYHIEHMLQWGTPSDVEEYNTWSNYFKNITLENNKFHSPSADINLIPLAGKGSRFKEVGYENPKPLISIGGNPMIIQAANYLPKGSKNIFVCLDDHLNKYPLKNKIKVAYPNSEVISINGITEGQAITCSLGLESVDNESSLLIAACDNGMLYNKEKYESLISDQNVDAVVWTFRHHQSSKVNPKMYGWVINEGNNAKGISVKKQISTDPYNDHAIVGTFYFKKTKYFKDALNTLTENDIRINGEFYVDSIMGVLIDKGLNVKIFEVDDYICWGTPDDYMTYIYWQSFFHKCKWHPYNLEKDNTVNKDSIVKLANKYTIFDSTHNLIFS